MSRKNRHTGSQYQNAKVDKNLFCFIGEEVGKGDEDIAEDFKRGLVGVEAGDEVGGVVGEELEGLLFVDFHAGPEDFGVHVVVAFFDEGASLHPFDEDFDIGHIEDNDTRHFNIAAEKVCLTEGAGDPVEKEELLIGEVAIRCN